MRNPAPQRLPGFTLIELVVVMTLLSVILAISAPRLGRFMAGRNVVEETRRLEAATRFARSESIRRNQRMELWINPGARQYGIRSEAGYLREEEKPIEFTLADKLGFELDDKAVALNEDGEAIMLFWPDGTIDETSPREVTLTEEGVAQTRLVLSSNLFEYRAQDPPNEKR